MAPVADAGGPASLTAASTLWASSSGSDATPTSQETTSLLRVLGQDELEHGDERARRRVRARRGRGTKSPPPADRRPFARRSSAAISAARMSAPRRCGVRTGCGPLTSCRRRALRACAARRRRRPSPSTRVGTIVRKRNTSTAATTPALLPPKPISAAVRLELDDADPARRDRNAAEEPRQRPGGERLDDAHLGGRRRRAPATRPAGRAKTVRLPASVASVSRCQRRLRMSTTSIRKRSKLLPPHATGSRWKRPLTQVAPRAARSPISARHAVAVEDEHERSDRDAQDRHADERRCREQLPSPPRRSSTGRAPTIGYARLASWFQRLTSVTDRATAARREARSAAASRRRSRSRRPRLPARRSRARWSPGSSSAPARSAGRAGATSHGGANGQNVDRGDCQERRPSTPTTTLCTTSPDVACSRRSSAGGTRTSRRSATAPARPRSTRFESKRRTTPPTRGRTKRTESRRWDAVEQDSWSSAPPGRIAGTVYGTIAVVMATVTAGAQGARRRTPDGSPWWSPSPCSSSGWHTCHLRRARRVAWSAAAGSQLA